MRIIFFLCLLPFISVAQEPPSILSSRVLQSALEDLAIDLQEKKIELFKNTSTELPFLEKMEFRTETNDFQLSEQEYALRFGLNTPKQIKAQRSLQNSLLVALEVNQQVDLNEALKKRYLWLIQAAFIPIFEKNQAELKLVLEDKINVLKNSTSLPNFDIDDLIDAEEKLHELEIELLQLKNQKEIIQSQFSIWTGRSVQISRDTFPLISISTIKTLINSWPSDSLLHPLLIERQNRVNRAIQEQQLELAETQNWLDFFQLKYGGRNSDSFREGFSIGLGLNLPVLGSNKIDLAELEMEKLDEENKFQLLKNRLEEEKKHLYSSLVQSIEKVELIEDQINNNQASFVFEQYRQQIGVPPLSLLKLKESLLKKEMLLLKSRQSSIIHFVNLLDTSGKMISLPLKNWLSPDLQSL